MDYAHIDEGRLDYFGSLPKAWRNTSGLHNADEETLRSLGWFPAEYVEPSYDHFTHQLGETSWRMTCDGEAVVVSKTVIKIPADEAPKILQAAKEHARARLAELRYDAETQGVELPDGCRIASDRDTQARLGTVALAAHGPIDWKMADGSFKVMTTEEVATAAGLVLRHVQQCYSVEAHQAAKIDAAQTLQELQELDIEGVEWPR